MKGGSRDGAGRPGWHGKTGAALALDVRRLHREGYFTSPRTMFWHWTNGAQIWMETEPGSLLLEYRHTDARGKAEDVRQRVGLYRTACHLGGSRPWFCAPCCNRRVAILYLTGWPRCRTCARLAYYSQSGDAIDRSWRRTRRIEVRLGWKDGNHGHGKKPAWMRRATYDRLRDAWWAEDEYREEQIARFIAGMVARHPFLAGTLPGF